MPKYRMLSNISGTRDGVDWPAAGETVILPDVEGCDLVAAGLAEVETAVAPKVETATVKTNSRRKG